MKALSRRAPTRLLARLVESPDLPDLVRRLPTEAFNALVREIGVEDAGELVALATTEQLTAAFDEDLFVNARPGERESFDQRRFLTWLEVLLEGGDEAVARRMTELSEDFVAQALSSTLLVFGLEALRQRLSEDDPAADRADKLLEGALCEEIDGYFLVAREDEGWDAVLALVLALDRHQRALLERLLDRCEAMASGYVDDLEALSEVLSATESLAEDVEAEREERRTRLGFVEPRSARSFLALARTPLAGELAAEPRDPVTRAYFRTLESAGGDVDASPGGGPLPGAPGRADPLGTVLGRLPRLSAPTEAAPDAEAVTFHLAGALRALAVEAPERFQERIDELAYLSNAVLAGAATAEGGRFRPGEAAEAAMATVALGAELEVRQRRQRAKLRTARASAAELLEVLRECPADLLFRRACSALAERDAAPAASLVGSRAELARMLEEL